MIECVKSTRTIIGERDYLELKSPTCIGVVGTGGTVPTIGKTVDSPNEIYFPRIVSISHDS